MGTSDHQDEETAIVRCGTTKGDITLQLIREWSPIGYDRAVELFERQFYNGCHFFRVLPKFLVQFGISYSKNNELQSFAKKTIYDDPRQLLANNSNNQKIINFESGIISYAGNGPNSRTSHLFISYGSAPSLGTELWETPIGKVIGSGMIDVAENFYGVYGDEPPGGSGPRQGKIYSGPEYIEDNFPLLDKILECTVERTKSGTSTGRDSGGGGGGGDVDSNKVRRMEAESDAVASNDDDDDDDDNGNNNKGEDDDAENRNYHPDNSNDYDDEKDENENGNEEEEEDKAVTHDDDDDDDDDVGNNEFQKSNDDDDDDDDVEINSNRIQQQQQQQGNIRSVGRDKVFLHYNEDKRIPNGESNNTTTTLVFVFLVALIGMLFLLFARGRNKKVSSKTN